MPADEHMSDEQFGTYYHMTTQAKFKPRAIAPENNTTLGGKYKPGLFLSKSPEPWVNAHGYVRPFVAEVKVPMANLDPEGGYHGERFLPAEHIKSAEVTRVMPLDARAREEFGEHGWIEDRIGKEFDTGADIDPDAWRHGNMYPFRGYTYSGPDVRDMPPEQIKQHRSNARKAARIMEQQRGS